MCAECLRAKCPSGCPNAPEPKAVYTCVACGAPICDGETCYYSYPRNRYFCAECVEPRTAEAEE
jgi:hypothetical protein